MSLPPLPPLLADPWFYAAAIPALILTGFSKSGFIAGSGALSVPILSLVMSPVQAAAIMLPVLLVSDAIGVVNYWKLKDALNFRILLVAGGIGTAVGWGTAAAISEAHVRLMVGLIGTVFALDWLLKLRRVRETQGPSWRRGLVWGSLSTYSSFIAQVAGPPLAIYLLPQRLPTVTYAATAVCFLTVVNWMKVIPYGQLGLFSRENVITSFALMPIAFVSVAFGLWLVRRIPSEPFYRLSSIALLAVSLKLVWDGSRYTFGL